MPEETGSGDGSCGQEAATVGHAHTGIVRRALTRIFWLPPRCPCAPKSLVSSPVPKQKAPRVDSRRSPDERVLSLLMLLLESSEPVTRSEIFDRIPAYQTTKAAAGLRKFERDKDELRALGVPIAEEQEKADGENAESAYHVRRRDYELRKVLLDDEERMALILAAEALRGSEGLVYRELINDALRKLSFDNGRLPSVPSIGINLPSHTQGARVRKLMATIGKAVESRKRLRLTYAGGGKVTERDVDPYATVYSSGNWQLVGHCHLRGKPRVFRVDRIRKLKTAPRPGTPDFERPADWNLASYVQRSPWVFQSGETDAAVDVVLDIGPERAWVADEDFGPTATRESLPEEWTRVRFRSANPSYIITRVLDGVGNLRIVEPADLRARVRAIATAVMEATP